MERDRQIKIVSVLALVLGVLGLSLGFTAFSNILIISSNATVKPESSSFSVDLYSGTSTSNTDYTVIGKSSVEGVNGTATISKDRKVITGVTADFNAPGQSVVYEFYAHNTGEYVAYLRSIIFTVVEGHDYPKVCTLTSDKGSLNLVEAACKDISLEVSVGDITVDNSITGISHHPIEKDGYVKVSVKLTYIAGGTKVNGPFKVEFGDVHLEYSSQDLQK